MAPSFNHNTIFNPLYVASYLIKGYLRYKTNFCHKVALDVYN